MRVVILGLSLSSSWGNGHATTYRALVKGLARAGHRTLFLERDVPWYRDTRDLTAPPFCALDFYGSVDELDQFAGPIADADAVILGSYVPEGVAVAERILALAGGLVAFYDIDTPVTLERLAAGGAEYLSPDLVPRFDLYLSFSGGRALDILRERFGAQHPTAFYCGVDADRYRPLAAEPRWDLSYLGTYSEDRQPGLEKLLIEPARRLPHRRFAVAGPQYPASIDWPANVTRIEHLGPDEHPAFYAASRLTLNVTRAAMRRLGSSPSVRLFEAGACGCPVVSDRWDGLAEVFAPGTEILVADGTDDIVALIEAADPGALARVGLAARERVLAEHTGERRAERLAALVRTLREDRAAAIAAQ